MTKEETEKEFEMTIRFRVSLWYGVRKYSFDVLRYKLLLRLWTIWHCDLRHSRLFMRKEVTPAHIHPCGRTVKRFVRYSYWAYGNRPFWHLCCNGDAGGWRTQLCNALEWRWRELEDRLFPSKQGATQCLSD